MEIELSPKEKRKIVCEMYLKGFTAPEINRVVGFKGKSTVYNIVLKAGIANKYIFYTNEMIDKIVDGWRDRKSSKQIAIKLGLTESQVHNQLRRLYLVD